MSRGLSDALVGTAAFERLLRGDSEGSTGLGLAIASRIIALHGSRCAATNPPGGGAEVRLVLPPLNVRRDPGRRWPPRSATARRRC